VGAFVVESETSVPARVERLVTKRSSIPNVHVIAIETRSLWIGEHASTFRGVARPKYQFRNLTTGNALNIDDIEIEFPFVSNALLWEIRESVSIAALFDQATVRTRALQEIVRFHRC
jgi:hypothetical protein